MQHYDQFYSQVYRKGWPSIRLALLSPNKYAALVNYFGQSEEVQIAFRQAGAYDLQYVYKKNLRRILRYFEKKQYINELKKKCRMENDNDNEQLNETILPDTNTGVTSDSEFEEIDAFFTDSDGSNDRIFLNAASENLNLGEFIPVSELKYSEEIVNDREYFDFYDINNEILSSQLEKHDEFMLNYPTNLNLFTFPRNDFTTFESPKLNKLGKMTFYLFNSLSFLLFSYNFFTYY